MRSLCSGFLRSRELFSTRPALEVQGKVLSFRELGARAASLAATLNERAPSVEPPLTGVFAYRSVTAFSGVLAALLRGHGYVPLSRRLPVARTRTMLERAGCRAVIVDSESEQQLGQVLEGIRQPLLVMLPERCEVDDLAERWPMHTILGSGDLLPEEAWRESCVSPDSVAYLLFTSGSTGAPKGVIVAHRNVTPFVAAMVNRYDISEKDRLSQVFDMTFDLSVFDMFVAWERGACVCCPSEKTVINPGRFIQRAELTLWFSVPSTGVLMKRLGMLKPNRYPSLRWSLFCGEPLPVEVARAWAEAAPHSILENLYGPTELTVACTAYRWNPETSVAESELGIVPIGAPYAGMETLVVDENLKEVAPGSEGELLMTGPQLTLGYWQDAERTASAFVTPAGNDRVYYRTGDRVRKPMAGGPMVYLGRLDNQIKIHGHRVELGEIEAVLREEAGVDAAVALGWPVTSSGANGVVAFLGTVEADIAEIRQRLEARLPNYMVPREFHFLSALPLNSNGKIDRKALLAMLKVPA